MVCRRAALGESDVRLFEIDVLPLTRIRAYQPFDGPRALKMLDERKQRTFARIESDEIEVVEDARLTQRAQLGVAIAATQDDDGGRVRFPDRLRDAECTIDVSGEGRADEHEIGPVFLERFERQVVQIRINEARLSAERSM